MTAWIAAAHRSFCSDRFIPAAARGSSSIATSPAPNRGRSEPDTAPRSTATVPIGSASLLHAPLHRRPIRRFRFPLDASLPGTSFSPAASPIRHARPWESSESTQTAWSKQPPRVRARGRRGNFSGVTIRRGTTIVSSA